MALSSVSQDGVFKDAEKFERRSRIRAARARQINPQVCKMESSATVRYQPSTLLASGAVIEDSFTELSLDTRNASTYRKHADVSCGNENIKTQGTKLNLGSKGKQQRDRRKLREKRRSTGVVNLAITESAGGSTAGEEDMQSLGVVALETKKNTQKNETIETDAANADNPLQQEQQRSDRNCPNHLTNNRSCQHDQNSLYRQRSMDKIPGSKNQPVDGDQEVSDNSFNLSQKSSATFVTSNTNTTKHSSPGFLNIDPTPNNVDTTTVNTRNLCQKLKEKDRKIMFLENQIQKLYQDSAAISEENQKLQEENSALLRAITMLQ